MTLIPRDVRRTSYYHFMIFFSLFVIHDDTQNHILIFLRSHLFSRSRDMKQQYMFFRNIFWRRVWDDERQLGTRRDIFLQSFVCSLVYSFSRTICYLRKFWFNREREGGKFGVKGLKAVLRIRIWYEKKRIKLLSKTESLPRNLYPYLKSFFFFKSHLWSIIIFIYLSQKFTVLEPLNQFSWSGILVLRLDPDPTWHVNEFVYEEDPKPEQFTVHILILSVSIF